MVGNANLAHLASLLALVLAASCGGLVREDGAPSDADAGDDAAPIDDASAPDASPDADDATHPDAAPAPDASRDAPAKPDASACAPTATSAHVAQVTAGSAHTCARMSDGTVKCWGGNAYGELGDGTMNGHLTPTQVPCLTDVVHISAGSRHTCAVKHDASVLCWGDNGSGQLGIGLGATTQLVPKTIIGLNGFIEVAAGNNHSCAVRGDGTVSCWGDDLNGQIGAPWNGHSVPPTIPGITRAVQIVVGEQFTCVRLAQGTITCWGANDKRQRGDAPPHGVGDSQSTTAGVIGALELSANVGEHNCARVAGDTLCWGYDFEGQLGDGTTAYSKPPVSVIDGAHVAQISAGSAFTCGVWLDGSVQCWGGYGFHGVLGDGYADHASPAVVPGVAGAVFVAAGDWHTCALLRDGSVWCWGDNNLGQLGDGTTTRRFAAAPVPF